MVKEHDAAFEFQGAYLCLDFANTGGVPVADEPAEQLHSYADLLAWSRAAGLLEGERARRLERKAEADSKAARAAFARALALRAALYRAFAALAAGRKAAAAELKALNACLAEALSHLRVVRAEDGYAWAWDDADHLEGLLWPVARSAAELLTSGELKRVGACANDACGWLFFDTSKNHSRRWCSMASCGNVAKARRHYRRKKRKT